VTHQLVALRVGYLNAHVIVVKSGFLADLTTKTRALTGRAGESTQFRRALVLGAHQSTVM